MYPYNVFMKKVRFESSNKPYMFKMNDSECHSPRPFIERDLRSSPPVLVPEYPRVLTYSNDPIQKYECSNSSPYPIVNRTQVTCFPEKDPCWKPSDDLNLSLLETSSHEPRQSAFSKSILKDNIQNKYYGVDPIPNPQRPQQPLPLTSVENNAKNNPPNLLVRDNSFFIQRDNLNKYHLKSIQTRLNTLSLEKENYPLSRKVEAVENVANTLNNPIHYKPATVSSSVSDDCRCHHCIKNVECMQVQQPLIVKERLAKNCIRKEYFEQACVCSTLKNQICSHCHHATAPLQQNICKTCSCQNSEPSNPMPQNAVDRKTWEIQKYEHSKQSNNTVVEKQNNVSKEKREPTVADLFKIIKLQNEQLQLLQEKVDKFMSSRQNVQPTLTCTEHVALNTVENNSHKMSVGVMTSFEMIRTSTVINKEVITQSNEAQIQCNRSQISIKEVVSDPVNMNFLDGINKKHVEEKMQIEQNNGANGKQADNVCEEKTLNELSLYNVEVDNATTPLMSPEQTLYLDVRDYSDSEASSHDQSNVGWTYYNKVMTHVNGMLQDSEMPSSASALYRNMRQQCVKMHIDTTNVSVTKRVKFGDDPLGLHQPHIYAPATDTSLKMNQLAAKYLKNMPAQAVPRPAPLVTAAPIDMSFATRNYMEKHRLLQGMPTSSKSPQVGELPRFLDITALKKQPKFL